MCRNDSTHCQGHVFCDLTDLPCLYSVIWLACGYTVNLPEDVQGAVGCHHTVKTLHKIPAAEDFQEMSPHHHPLHAADFVVLFPEAISSCYGKTERVKEAKYEQQKLHYLFFFSYQEPRVNTRTSSASSIT